MQIFLVLRMTPPPHINSLNIQVNIFELYLIKTKIRNKLCEIHNNQNSKIKNLQWNISNNIMQVKPITNKLMIISQKKA